MHHTAQPFTLKTSSTHTLSIHPLKCNRHHVSIPPPLPLLQVDVIYGDSSPPAWFPGQITKVTEPAAATPPTSAGAQGQGTATAIIATTADATQAPAAAAAPIKPWKKGGSGKDKVKIGPTDGTGSAVAVTPFEPLYDVLFDDGDTAERVSRLKIRKAGECTVYSTHAAKRSPSPFVVFLPESLSPSNISSITCSHILCHKYSPPPPRREARTCLGGRPNGSCSLYGQDRRHEVRG